MPKRGIKSKKTITVLATILILSFILMTVNFKREQGPFSLESLVLWIFSPFQVLFTRAIQSVSNVFDHYVFVVNVSRENEVLRQEIDRLVREKNELLEQLQRQDRVMKLLDYKELNERKAVVATVIGRDATQWSKVVFINKGTEDGINENLAVVTDAGVIGHILQAAAETSKVLLITDSRSSVDAIFRRTRISGVVAGTGEEICDMKYVPITAGVNTGDVIISSGLGGIFPKGLMIGTVTQVVKKKQGLFQDITVKPSSDLSRLEEVLVLLP